MAKFSSYALLVPNLLISIVFSIEYVKGDHVGTFILYTTLKRKNLKGPIEECNINCVKCSEQNLTYLYCVQHTIYMCLVYFMR